MSEQDLDSDVPSVEKKGSSDREGNSVGKGQVIERRQRPRFGVSIPVRVTTQGPIKTVRCEGLGSDLNGGGLAVRLEIELEVGSQIAVEFAPAYSEQPIAFRCFVRNRNGDRYGVEFITENDEDYQKAGELQERLAAMQPSVLQP